MEHPLITAVTHSHGEARVTLKGVPDTPGIAGRVTTALADGERQHRHDHPERARAPTGAQADMSFTVPRDDVRRRAPALDADRGRARASSVQTDEAMGKVSIVGAGMKSHPGVAAKVFTVARRQRHQHRDDLDLADPHLLRRPRRPACPTPSRRCTRAFELSGADTIRPEQPFGEFA